MKKTVLFLLAGVLLYSCTPREAPNTFSPNTFKDNRDNKVYKTVTIGEQTWMAENLKYLPDGSEVSGPVYGDNSTPYYYVYDFSGGSIDDAIKENNYKTYGVLYNWAAAKDACPEGWHLPSDAEWTQLENYLGGINIAGKKLKSRSGWNYNGNGTDNYGFSALPGGSRGYYGSFYDMGNNGYWWSSTEYEYNTNNAWTRSLSYNSWIVYRGNGSKAPGLSVRCVKD
ncbi:MAG: fibrobacter succinogenes major paralogous domain-containing protein [Bacteroidales bacterium]|jgi:uncharacterized protein (TIGR02145 family)